MKQEIKEFIESPEFQTTVQKSFNEALKSELAPVVGVQVAEKMKDFVERMRIDRVVSGKDASGLTENQKKDFVVAAKAVVFGLGISKENSAVSTKANEAFIEEQDNRGGFLVSTEVAAAILRIAASVGTVMSQAQKWDMKTDELGIPNYTGAYLTGSYLGVDVAGVVTGMQFGQAVLVVKKWQLAFAIGNDLLADASVNLADWLLAIAGESLANMVDQQGLIGTGAPFVGILNNSNVPVYTLSSGKVHFSSTTPSSPNGFDVLVDGSAMIGSIEESILDGSAFYMHRTVWALLRVQKDTAGNFILPYAGWAPGTLENIPGGGPIKPAGQILGYSVYTNRWMPAASADAVSTQFMIFGNMKGLAFGNKGEMRVEQFASGAFGGKEIALADQRAIVYRHRHALTVALAKAFVVAQTAAS